MSPFAFALSRGVVLNSVLSLFHYQGDKTDFYPYLVFDCASPARVFSLSPDVMHLQGHVFVADLSVVKSYWQKRANTESMDLLACLEKVLASLGGLCERAVLCHHPFQGLVFYNHLSILEAQGVYQLDSLFSQKIFRNMSWYPWLLSARQAHDCFENNKSLKKERRFFFSSLRRFERFVTRLDLKEFSELEEAQFFEISRRFQGFIGLLWKWTFPQRDDESSEQMDLLNQHYQKLQGFTWKAYQPKSLPLRQNFLEYPISDWQRVEPLLQQDFNKLADWDFRDYRILEFHWEITLFDMEQIHLRIPFRYPLDFVEQSLSEPHKDPPFAFRLGQAQAFFHLEANKALEEKDLVRKKFIERTSHDWWLSGDEFNSLRDYFICELKDLSLVFAYRDYQGRWFQYGY